MKLHTLTMRDIGPFTGEQTIHFDSLPSLFLISGPTGSGKTSILDAITFALFGNTSGGSDSSDSRIRSHFANPLEPCFVDLVFEVESGIYRAYRSPKWHKAGNKTESNASGFLMKLSSLNDEDGEVITDHVRELTAHCTRLLGVNHAQFCQAVLLPQGKFDAFLMMSSKERAAGLEKIFRTDVYSRFTTELRARANTARQEQQTLAQQMTNLADRINHTFTEEAENTSAEMPSALSTFRASPQGKNLETLSAWINDVYHTHLDTLASLQSRAHAAQQASAEAEHLLAQAEENARLIAQHNQLQQRLKVLTSQEKAIQAQRTQLEAAREAAPLLEDIAALERHRRARTATEHSLATYERATGFAQRSLRQLREFSEEINQRYDARHKELLALARYRQAREQLDAALASGNTHRNELEGLRSKFASLTAEAASCAEALTQARENHEAYTNAHAEVERLAEHIDVYIRTAAQEEEQQARKRQAEEAYAEAEERLANYRARERSHAAWQLATTLVDGEPCPACGSRTHPSPATAPAEVDPSEAEDLEAELATRAQNREDARLRAQRLADQREALEAEGSLEEWREQLAQHNATVEQFGGLALTITALEGDYARLEAEKSTLNEHMREVELALAAAEREASLREDAAREARQGIDFSFVGVAALTDAQLGEGGRVNAGARVGAGERVSAGEHTDTDAQPCAEHNAGAVSGNSLPKDMLHGVDAQDYADVDPHMRQSRAASDERDAELRAAWEDDARAEREAALLADQEIAAQADVDRLAQVRDSLAGHQEALEEFVRCHALVEQAEENVNKNLDRSPFTSEGDVRQAALESVEMTRLEAAILAYSTELHSVRERLADPRFANVDPDMDVTVAAHNASVAREAEKEIRDRISREEERGRIAAGVLKDYQDVCEAFSAGAENAQALTFLANIASGGEGSLTNIPLASYVLRERFAQLLDGANEHLARISHERYQLVHVDDRVGSERQVGLGLLAVDEFAGGTRREVNSLSGGERFYFSLCLALALSDLIQQENGGIEIGTLLIDEGFGALSPERLDEVVEVIRSLAAHGQRIGVISHVEGLKRMIPAQIALQHSAGRSKLELVTETE